MKKKTYFKTFLILAVMSAILFPAAIFADEPEDCDLWVGGHAVTETGYVTGDGIEGEVYYDDEARVLTLSNAAITGLNDVQGSNPSRNSNIFFCDEPLTIQTSGLCTVGDADKTDLAIDAHEDLTITGDNSLKLYSRYYCVWADEDMRIDGAIVYMTAKGNAAVSANKCLKVDNSVVDIECTGYDAIRAQRSIMIYDSAIVASSLDSDTISAQYGDITIVDSVVIAKAGFSGKMPYRMHTIEAVRGKIRIVNSDMFVKCEQQEMAAMQAKLPISIIDSEFTNPTDAVVGESNGVYTILDSNGNVLSNFSLEPVKLPSALAAAGKTATLKSGAKKLKKNMTISKAKAYTILNASGKVTYAKVKADKSGSKFKVDKKTGKITAKKGLKNGTYKLTVKITDPGDDSHYGTSKNVVVKIKVKK